MLEIAASRMHRLRLPRFKFAVFRWPWAATRGSWQLKNRARHASQVAAKREIVAQERALRFERHGGSVLRIVCIAWSHVESPKQGVRVVAKDPKLF